MIGAPHLKPHPNLGAYPNHMVPIKGKTNVAVKLGKQIKHLPILVTSDTNRASLFGLDWMSEFDILPTHPLLDRINQVQSSMMHSEKDVEEIFNEFHDLFEGLERVCNFRARIRIKDTAIPVIRRVRPVPFAWKLSIDNELHWLIANDIIVPVNPQQETVEWASSVVPQTRSNGNIRLCGDFKTTINPHIIVNDYPLPLFEEVVAKLATYKEYSIIDLKDAFNQVEIDEECQKHFIIATHRGYFRFKRLPFGIPVAPLIFQKFMDSILSDIPSMAWYQDDIVLGSADRADHLQRLRAVLTRLREIRLKTQPSKLKLLQSEINFLGYRLNG